MMPADESLWRRLNHTPLLDVLRGRMTCRCDWRGPIESSDLPATVQELILRVTRRTRLWRTEKRQVALELISHFGEGMDAGRSGEQLIEFFGKEKLAAKLIRRAKKRNRPLLWRLHVRLLQALAAVLVFYLAAWLILALPRPKPSVDYLASLNADTRAAGENDCAWPIYRQAWIADFPGDIRFREEGIWGDGYRSRPVRPGEAGWEKVPPLLSRHAGLLAAGRQGGSRPGLGLSLSMDGYRKEDARAIYGSQAGISRWEPAEHKTDLSFRPPPLLWYLEIPHLSHLQTMAWLMDLDMVQASLDGDSGRMVADYHALQGLARQSREHPVLINQLVAVFILNRANESLADMLCRRPEAFTTPDLLRVKQMIRQGVTIYRLDFRGLEYALKDLVQHVYSDDGRGDGRLTAQGLRLMVDLADADDGGIWSSVRAASLPFRVARGFSRQQVVQMYDQYLAEQQAWADQPLSRILQDDELLVAPEKFLSSGKWVMPLVFPGGSIREAACGQAFAEAVEVGIALELFRRENTHYPRTLTELVPDLLLAPPIDHSTDQPLLYKLVEGKPLLYGRGLDGDEDGGRNENDKMGIRVPKTGDWVLYPVPFSPPIQEAPAD